MKDRYLWFIVGMVGFYCLVAIADLLIGASFEFTLLNLFGWTYATSLITAVYYGVFFFKDRRSKDIWRIKESVKEKKILKIAILVPIALFLMLVLLAVLIGLPSTHLSYQT